MPKMARPLEITSRLVTVLARSAGFRNNAAPTTAPSFTWVVRAATAERVVYASRQRPPGAALPDMRWSPVKNESKPAASPATTSSVRRSNAFRVPSSQ
jgi:hypothetical protein